MFVQDKKRILRRDHHDKDMVNCLVGEVFALRHTLGLVQNNLNDLNNRLRYLEYLSRNAEKP